jgi:hypothetical protein
MNEFKPFTCGECGRAVKLENGVGRTWEYAPGFTAQVPDDFLLPTCSGCGEIYSIPGISEKLDFVLRKQFLESQARHYEKLVRILMLRHHATKRDIVRACGITPSYLSHVLAGKQPASATLTRLLEAFVADGSEFDRHVDGRPWTYEGVFPFAVKKEVEGSFAAPHGEWLAVNDSVVYAGSEAEVA